MLSDLLSNAVNLVDIVLGQGGGSGSGTVPSSPTTTNTPSLTTVLKLDAGQLVDLKASLGTGESLLVVNGNVFEKHANGSLVDLGLDIGTSPTGSSSLVSVGGKVFAEGKNGGLIDLNLGIGADGTITGLPQPGHPGTPPSQSAPTQDVFRFFNTDTGVHFYTSSTTERDSVIQNMPQMKYEGNSFDVAADQSGELDVFRFYNTSTGTHFYTASEAERDTVRATLSDFNYEGVGYTAYATDGDGAHKALYRFYNTDTGTHFYTADEHEMASVIQNLHQMKYEGIAYYVDGA